MYKVLVVAAGAPGSGKTTAMNAVAENRGLAVICPDDIRLELFGDASEQRDGHLVFQIAYDRLRRELCDDASCGAVFDATNCRRKARRSVLAEAAGCFDYAICAVAETPLHECLARNRSRERFVPEEVIEQMFDNLYLNWPSTDEGFDEVIGMDALDAELSRLGW